MSLKMTLMIEASAAVIAKLLPAIEAAEGVKVVAGAPVAAISTGEPRVAPDDDDETTDSDAPAGGTDATGLIWDARIHSDPPKTTAKGVWRKRKNVDAATFAAVEAELRSTQATTPAPIQQQPVMQMPQTTAPVEQPVQMMQPVTQATTPAPIQQQPVMQMPQTTAPVEQPVQVTAPVQQPVTPQPVAYDFASFMAKMTQIMQTNPAMLDIAYLGTVVQRINTGAGSALNAITDLSARPDLIGYAVQIMTTDGRWSA